MESYECNDKDYFQKLIKRNYLICLEEIRGIMKDKVYSDEYFRNVETIKCLRVNP